MRIALPTSEKGSLENPVAPHFGWAKNYLIFDTKTKEFEIFSNSEISGRKELPPEFLNKLGVKVVICFGLGRKAFDKFKEFGIKTYKALEKNISENVKDFQDGKLKELEDYNPPSTSSHSSLRSEWAPKDIF